MQEEIFCLKCRKRTPNMEVTIDQYRNMQKTKCAICNTKKNRFIKKINNINGD